MISYQRLPGRARQETLDGISDWFGMPTWVKQYWAVLKGKINELQNLGQVISAHQQKLGIAYTNLVNQGRQDLADQLKDEANKVNDDLQKWWKVKGYIDTYLPQWAKLETNEVISVPGSGVGVVPFILAGMALTALAYCVNTGLALLQDYAFKSKLTSAIIEGKMTSGQAAEVLSVPRNERILEKVVSNVGVGVGIGVPTALLVAGGAYLLWTTGVLKGILGMFSGGGSSQQSGG